MKEGDTVFIIHRTQNVLEAVLGKEGADAQGFYTRWGAGHIIYLQNAAQTGTSYTYNDENIFSTREAAQKELFMRHLRYPRLRGAA